MSENSENSENKEKAPAEVEQVEGLVDQVVAHDATIENSLVGMVQAEGNASIENSFVGMGQAEGNVTIANSISAGMVAGQNMEVAQSFGGAVVAGASMEMDNSVGVLMVAGANIDLHNGKAGCIHCQQAIVESGTIGVLLADDAKLGEGVKVMMTRNQAVAFGAAFGLVAGMLGFLLRRRR